MGQSGSQTKKKKEQKEEEVLEGLNKYMIGMENVGDADVERIHLLRHLRAANTLLSRPLPTAAAG